MTASERGLLVAAAGGVTAFYFREEIRAKLATLTGNAGNEIPPAAQGAAAAAIADTAIIEASTTPPAATPVSSPVAPEPATDAAAARPSAPSIEVLFRPEPDAAAGRVDTVTGTQVNTSPAVEVVLRPEPDARTGVVQTVTGTRVTDPAIYGPVNGVYVTLSQWQAWQSEEFARNQADAAVRYATTAAQFPGAPANPYLSGIPETAQGYLDQATAFVSANPEKVAIAGGLLGLALVLRAVGGR